MTNEQRHPQVDSYWPNEDCKPRGAGPGDWATMSWIPRGETSIRRQMRAVQMCWYDPSSKNKASSTFRLFPRNASQPGRHLLQGLLRLDRSTRKSRCCHSKPSTARGRGVSQARPGSGRNAWQEDSRLGAVLRRLRFLETCKLSSRVH